MSHKHKRILKSIFTEPVSGNLHWREVQSLLRHLGAEVQSTHGARLTVKLNKSRANCTGRITAALSASMMFGICESSWPAPV